MPRIPTSLVRTARAIDPLLPALLAPCRDLQTAQNELRWLREHVEKVAKTRRANRGDRLAKGALLRRMVKERATGKPLQYLLKSEYFADLEIVCRPGVLIPRADTAASITHLARLLKDAPNLPRELRVLDLCTGTGCIPLLLQHELSALSTQKDVSLRALGVDISKKALDLARYNLQRRRQSTNSSGKHPMKKGEEIDFIRADILINPFADQIEGQPMSLEVALDHACQPHFWDILIANPPYISPAEYWNTTTRSVRGFEPKLALVPPPPPPPLPKQYRQAESQKQTTDTQQGDRFYPRLLEIAQDVEAKIVLLEVADVQQAQRVAQLARRLCVFDGVEIWGQQPDVPATTPATPTPTDADADTTLNPSTTEPTIPILGQGHARSLLCWRGPGTSWLNKEVPTTSPPGHHHPSPSLVHQNHASPSSPEPTPIAPTRDLQPRFDMHAWDKYAQKPLWQWTVNWTDGMVRVRKAGRGERKEVDGDCDGDGGKIDGKMGGKTEGKTGGKTEWKTEGKTEGKTGRKSEEKTGGKTEGKTGGKTAKKTDKP
ncbi:S-adenosyl-L-methionine-dependent methyltransferase [Decorospora gaudefroyi]|uniref:S-adenosyl-L-methionine-dependent methyltransferase n=1 Tax=Decorospora gaudefroyi TaxID=184978 RepID=A0A6A5KI88_9PLEO|nr:S-adenosyl-L-methionine-dependent methyltransferase [Decorospora gaudefroyi]